jgi:hypothetical protein
MAPNRRRGSTFLTGTSRTTGMRPRAITTSSPAQARAMSFDRCVFAACTVTGFM